MKDGFRQVLFPSGFGYVAGATEYYEVSENPNAAQQNLRLTYVSAFTKAKLELTRGLGGVRGRGREILQEHLSEINTAMRSAYNISGQYVEDLDQVAEGLLRGYVVYEVDHDPENQEVYVSIVTTPKTLSAIANVSGSVIRCASIDHGIDYVLRQVSYGVVPPVGGKVIAVPATGQVALISFGSDIIGQHKNPTVDETLLQASERAAAIRANDAMIGMINGDRVVWVSGLYTAADYALTEFKTTLEADESINYELLEQVQNEVLGTMQLSDDYATFRRGHMPPGVASQVYSDGQRVYVINVYLPEAAREARRFYEEVQNAKKGSTKLDPYYELGGSSPVQKARPGR